ncbi:MAG: SDR family oxidoreductase [Candidatus Caldatribacterium sp.]|uniref:SDR family NAD(P)-dependent oxidoreductase n=1 Tax=Candidatus Caldatribacterium sp. TaxID=2282143 RepID=UPI002998CD24|nr:SDR family oxidoreductase [Candidatus Caldatribacterium sp.]MCX7729803.1 SDR family oxidoreductase [Candidatus Caldatribacterium sp.]MDW8081393.1 SDR family oxidoreductase [Candidatus Calescibacterium sp.]
MEAWKGKVALVTGASRGIGRAIARTLAEKGLSLALCARSKDKLEALKDELRPFGVEVFICPGDLADPSFPPSFVRETGEYFGRIDVVINNAGIALSKPLEVTTLEEWELQMAVNVRAPFLICREALPYLRRSPLATIINISSVVGTKGYVHQGAYTASKHALMGFTKVLARELHKEGIRVHVIAPGGVETDLIAVMRPDLLQERLIAPSEIAEIVWFLLSLREGNAVIDEVHVRRASNEPWK